MPSYKEPSFQDRVATAAKAKQKALDKLKAKPPVDPAVLEERRQASEARDRELAAKRAEKAAALAQEKAEKAASKAAALAEQARKREEEEAAAALKNARLTPPSPAEMKAARDARYAARKARK